LGQSIGNLIRDADNRADSNFHNSMLDELSANEEGLVNPKVSEVVAQANSLAAHALVPTDNVCGRKWTAQCPDGWSPLSTSACLAPLGYENTGGCKGVQSFKSASAMDKYKFASTCNAPWPCEDACGEGHAYAGCPAGWTDMGDGFCETTAANAKCMTSYKFADMSIGQKQELAIACGIEWACKTTCAQDYSKTCPEGWTTVAGLCMAPTTYAGDCSYGIDTSGMTESQKKSFAEKCSVTFPCLA